MIDVSSFQPSFSSFLKVAVIDLLVVLIVACLLVLPFLLLPLRWRSRARPVVTLTLQIASFFAALYLIVWTLMLVYLPSPLTHFVSDCGPVSQCDSASWEAWRTSLDRYPGWLLTPPSLRPSCDWVGQTLCEEMAVNDFVGSWGEYSFFLASVLGITVITALAVNGMFNLYDEKKKPVLVPSNA